MEFRTPPFGFIVNQKLASSLPTSGNGSGAYSALDDYTINSNAGGDGGAPDHVRIIREQMTYSGLGKAECSNLDIILNGAVGGSKDGAGIVGTTTVDHAEAGGGGAYLSCSIVDVAGGGHFDASGGMHGLRVQIGKNRAGSVAQGVRVLSTGALNPDSAYWCDGNFTKLLDLSTFTVSKAGLVTLYNNIPTAGGGVPAIYGSHSSTANTGAVSNAINYTPPATAGTYRVTIYVRTTAFTSNASFAAQLAYKTPTGQSDSFPMTMVNQATTNLVTGPSANNQSLAGVHLFQIDNSATAITLSTLGTFTFTYNMAVTLEQLA